MKIPEGWKLVPTEPTEEMIAASFEVTMSMAANAKHYKKLVYRNMLNAAPTPDSYADKEILQIITERDQYHDWADKLADAIAERLGVEIGEHSNTNAPWQNALDAIEAPTREVEQ